MHDLSHYNFEGLKTGEEKMKEKEEDKKGLKTGEDAVAFFATHGASSPVPGAVRDRPAGRGQVKFVSCNPRPVGALLVRRLDLDCARAWVLSQSVK